MAASIIWKTVKSIILQIIFFTEVTGNRVSVSAFKNTYNKFRASLQHGISLVVSFSRIFSEDVCFIFFFFFDCSLSSKNLLSLFFCFFKNSEVLYFLFLQTDDSFNSN